MSVAEMDSYSALVTAGQLSLESLWKMLEAGERLPKDFDPDEEQKAIDATTLPADPTLALDPLTGLPQSQPTATKPIIDLTAMATTA